MRFDLNDDEMTGFSDEDEIVNLFNVGCKLFQVIGAWYRTESNAYWVLGVTT